MPNNDGQLISKLKKVNLGSYNTIIALVVIVAVLSIMSPVFLTRDNINNVLLQMSINGILAIGMTMVILTGWIDLSVGSVVAVCGVALGMTFKATGGNELIAIIASILTGLLFGAINGAMVAVFKLPAFIATLGMMTLARGTALYLCSGRPISGYSNLIKSLGSGKILGVFIPIIMMLVIYAIAFVALNYTQFGRNVYAVGGSAEVSRLSGINVPRTTWLVFVISGVLCGLAGVLLTGRLNSAQPTAGYNYEMDAIASAVIGGTSMVGGEGKVLGTLIGAIIIQILRNGLNLLNISSYLQQIVIGLVIIIAVFIDVYRTKHRR
jgi:ribose transport system permease protein